MSSRWWRAYDEAVDEPKLLLLPSDKHRWAWFCLMCLASAYGGTLPSIDVVALKLRTSKHKAAELITALVTAGLIDRNGDAFEPHNWKGRQYRSDVTDPTNAVRQKRFRNRQRNGESNGVTAVTVKRPETETETETEKKDAAAPPSNLEKELFDRGKQVLGKQAGGMIAKLLKVKNGSVAMARAAVEQASEKQDPREYIAKILNGSEAVREGDFVWKSGIPGVLF